MENRRRLPSLAAVASMTHLRCISEVTVAMITLECLRSKREKLQIFPNSIDLLSKRRVVADFPPRLHRLIVSLSLLTSCLRHPTLNPIWTAAFG